LVIVERVQEPGPQPKRFDRKVQISNKDIVNWLSAAYRGLSHAKCQTHNVNCKFRPGKLWIEMECQNKDCKFRPGRIVNHNINKLEV